MPNYQLLTKRDIEDAFEYLLKRDSQTTSLDVKKELRSRGFWATQNEVGIALRDIADANGIDWDYNGVFRTYRQADTMSPTQLGSQSVANVNASPAAKTPPVNSADRNPIDNPSLGDWVAYDANDPSHRLYFKGKLTATQARYAFSLQTGIDYITVRNRRY